MSESALYRDLVLEHNRSPRGLGALPACTHAAEGDNPLCGDRLRIELALDAAGRVQGFAFSGEACAITTATASLLGERVRGLDAAAIADLDARFARLVRGDCDADPALDGLNALAELRAYPARRKCALLPWATLAAALRGTPHATTEATA
ncbi:MAG: Fe-S cluster assembly sulfur transfer protein SufU [Mizugakiibacter sp.]|uniref:Fe-S cluster assembly sulfur transfer protein SufU n=1 Tax=Mizugakiibacter sp. TaxID=1972610 RepID=UPI0031CAE923|nr:SUF system NifU family Fe-S cluster assembly protein [Xanthomonadaceae bacterium]